MPGPRLRGAGVVKVPILAPLDFQALPGRLATYALHQVEDRFGYALDVQVAIRTGAFAREASGLLRIVALAPLKCDDGCGLEVRPGEDVSHRFEERVKVEMVDAALREMERLAVPS